MEGQRATFAAWATVTGTQYNQILGSYGSYGINWWVNDLRTPQNKLTTGTGKRFYPYKWNKNALSNLWRTPNVRNPNRIPLFSDSWWWGNWPENFNDPPPHSDGQAIVKHTQGMRSRCLDRHDGYINMLFLDYSVRKVGLKELWKLKWHRNFDTNFNYYPDIEQWPPWMDGYKEY